MIPPIREVAASWSGRWAAMAEIERRIHMVDVHDLSCGATFDTEYSWGGSRLAVSNNGNSVVAAGYYDHLACYDAASGKVRWRRKDLRKVQGAAISRDNQFIAAWMEGGRGAGTLQILELETGDTVATYKGVGHAWWGDGGQLAFSTKQYVEIRSQAASEGRRLKLKDVLDVSLQKELAAVSTTVFRGPSEAQIKQFGPIGPARESVSDGGFRGIRCVRLADHAELWRADPGDDWTFLRLSYCPTLGCLVALHWCVERHEDTKLVRIDEQSGETTTVTAIGRTFEAAFCLKGTALLRYDGVLFDCATGAQQGAIAWD